MPDFEGATLALQHYYDIVEVSRKMPLLTLYHANEQPFGRRMAVWMAAEPYSKPLPADIKERLEAAMLQNRAVRTQHALRILDFGSGEGHGFVVTDDIVGETLFDYIHNHGMVQHWQLLRLAEQLIEIVKVAHDADFRFLCLTTKNIFITNEERFDIMTAPLGIGLHRHEILQLKDTPIVADLVRHIPCWEYTSKNETPSSASLSEVSLSTESVTDSAVLDETDESAIDVSKADEDIQDLDEVYDSVNLASHSGSMPRIDEVAPAGMDADTYNVAAILYEALSCMHPYFGTSEDLCGAVFTMMHQAPKDLSAICEAPKPVCDAIMRAIVEPKEENLPSLLSTIAHSVDPQQLDLARRAEKTYLAAPVAQEQNSAKLRHRKLIPHPEILAAVVGVALILLTGIVTHHFSSQRSPVDLFALPELLPTAAEGVDVVLPLPRNHSKMSVYLVSLSDGTPIRLGELPLIYRQQPVQSNLVFMTEDERGNFRQIRILTNDEPGVQVVDTGN